MIEQLLPKDCTLCGSCVDACPTGAISYQNEYLDFTYPKVDPDKCINCNLCKKACPALSVYDAVGDAKVYAAKNPDPMVCRNSSSGGVFWALAEEMLSRDGYVCGAVFDSDFRVYHSVSNKVENARMMMGSKYAQSDLTGIYKKIKELLQSGEQVLFTGCPCQVAGVGRFLGKDYENLITVDVICHGVPSNAMLRAYLDLQEQKFKSKVDTIRFRDKKYGWHRSSVRIGFANGAEYCTPITADAFYTGFLRGVYLKESCYDCKFKHFQSGSDLTMGDFWGAEAVYPGLDDNTGLSAVISKTPKGDRFLHQCRIGLHDASLETVIKYNRNLIVSTKKNPLRNRFYAFAKENGYSLAIKKLLSEHPVRKLCRESRYMLRCIAYLITGRGKPLY